MERGGRQEAKGKCRFTPPRLPRVFVAAIVVALSAFTAIPAGATSGSTTSTSPTTQPPGTTTPGSSTPTTSTPPSSTPPTTEPARPIATDRAHAVYAPDGCPTTPPPGTLRLPPTSHLTLYQLCVDSVRAARTPAAALAIRVALARIGTPYSQARRNDPNIYDCSSFVTRAYQTAGVPIAYPATPNRIDGAPGENAATTKTMIDAAWATPVTPQTAKPGDFVFFPGAEPPNGHVGMLLAHHVIVHTNSSGDVAHVAPLNPTTVTAWRAVDPTKVQVRVDRRSAALTSAARNAHARYVAASNSLVQIRELLATTRARRIVALRQLAGARARRTAAAEAEDAARNHLRHVAAATYVQTGASTPAATILSVSSVMESARVDKYWVSVGSDIQDAITAYVSAKQAAEAEAHRLERHVAAIDADVRALRLEATREQTALANALADPSAPILGPSKLTPAQLVAWYQSTGHHEATSVPITAIAQLYVEEGHRAGVRGDVAFAEAVHDTDWFTFPATGPLSVHDSGLTVVGGCDSCVNVASYASAALAVRAHVQLLRTYADADTNAQLLGAPPVVPGVLKAQLKGAIASWRQLPAMTTTAPDYGNAILHTYDEIVTWVAAHPGAAPSG